MTSVSLVIILTTHNRIKIQSNLSKLENTLFNQTK